MQIKIGQIYKVKPECKNPFFRNAKNAKFIKFVNSSEFEILDENKKMISIILNTTFNPEYLEPFEKTLYNLELGDMVEDDDGDKRKVLSLIESSPENPIYCLSHANDWDDPNNIVSANWKSKNNFKVVQPEPTEDIKEMTVEEVSKLVGKKVKIVE